MRNARFWTFMAIFQLVFGLAVFGLTRHYTLSNPDIAAARVPSATTPHAQQEWPQSTGQDDLERLMSTFPGQVAVQDPNETLQRADALFASGDYGQAAEMYQRIISAGFRDAEVFNNLGLTLHYLGRSDEALKVLNQGIALDSGHQRIWLTLGYVSSQVGRFDNARLALATAVDMGAENDIGRAAAEMLQALP